MSQQNVRRDAGPPRSERRWWRRKQTAKQRDQQCVFCQPAITERAVEETGLMLAVPDAAPVTDGHLLVIPKRHTPDFFSLTEAERTEGDDLVRLLSRRLREDDPTVGGFNVGTNSGEVAGQTVFHAHLHLIPRRAGDVPRPAGGVRGVIPDKQDPGQSGTS